MSAANHILTGNTFTGGYALLCTHCGEVYVPSLPISIEMFLKVSRQFGKEHRHCVKPEAGALDPQSLLRKASIRHLRNMEERP